MKKPKRKKSPIAAIERLKELKEISRLEHGEKYDLEREYKPWYLLYSTSKTDK